MLSNEQKMVSVPREQLAEAAHRLSDLGQAHISEPLFAMIHRQDAQPHDEPVAYGDPKAFENFANLAHLGGVYAKEWMWAKPSPGLVPLFLHAELCKVERLIAQCLEKDALIAEMDRIGSAKLAEREKLLREIDTYLSGGPYRYNNVQTGSILHRKIREVLGK